jgi:hypothetical protein
MFDWFAARPGPGGGPIDRPTVPLTPAEREAFERISSTLQHQHRTRTRLAPLARLPRLLTALGLLPVGLVVVVLGAVWTVAWLASSVPAAFLGVLVQAGGIWLVVSSQAGAVAAAVATAGAGGHGTAAPVHDRHPGGP